MNVGDKVRVIHCANHPHLEGHIGTLRAVSAAPVDHGAPFKVELAGGVVVACEAVSVVRHRRERRNLSHSGPGVRPFRVIGSGRLA